MMILPSFTSLVHAFLDYLIAFAQTSSSGLDAAITYAIVKLDDATFVGTSDGVTSKFLRLPYAQPPTGPLRFSHPVAPAAYTGVHSASGFGPACPQQPIPTRRAFPPIFNMRFAWEIMGTSHNPSAPQSEDCLSLNVWAPANAQSGAELPVVVWIHGGVYQIGSSSFNDGKVIVERSVQIGEPVIFVGMNYRLSGEYMKCQAHHARLTIGRQLLASLQEKRLKTQALEIWDTEIVRCNFLLQINKLKHATERLALQWVQKYIHSFGGDPSKVVIWGQSAGAMSVAAHMVTNNGDTSGLFRGAYMQSGSLPPVGDMHGAQRYYDALVTDVGCQGSEPSTLDCLREVPFERLKKAIDASPSFMSHQSLALSWGARTDGDFLPESPRELASKGIIARVPFVIGTCDDEGTLFALPSLNITTTSEVLSYLSNYFFHNVSVPVLEQLLETHYPQDPIFGAPFGSGPHNKVTTQFKRLAAIVGDWVFEAPKRALLEAAEGRQDVWTFVSKRQKSFGVLGAAHSTDIRYGMFAPSDMTDHLIHFVNYLNPNGRVIIPLPSSSSPSPSPDVFDDEDRDVQVATALVHVAHLQNSLNATKVEGDQEQVQPQEPLTFQVPAYPSHHRHQAQDEAWPKYTAHLKAVLTYLDGQDSPRLTQIVYGFEREEQVGYLNELARAAWIP